MVRELGAGVDPWLKLLEEATAGEVTLAVLRLADLGDPRAVEPLVRLFAGSSRSGAGGFRRPSPHRQRAGHAVPDILLTDDLYRVPLCPAP